MWDQSSSYPPPGRNKFWTQVPSWENRQVWAIARKQTPQKSDLWWNLCCECGNLEQQSRSKDAIKRSSLFRPHNLCKRNLPCIISHKIVRTSQACSDWNSITWCTQISFPTFPQVEWPSSIWTGLCVWSAMCDPPPPTQLKRWHKLLENCLTTPPHAQLIEQRMTRMKKGWMCAQQACHYRHPNW